MSVPSIVEEICFICKKTSEQTILLSTNQFGSSDLDLRPPEMRRSTMIWWVQECPHCGYVNSNISNPTKIPEGWFTSEEYLSYGGREFVSRLAERFYKQHMIAMMEGNVKTAFFAVLHSAWACDDAGDYDSAVFCRKKALETLDKLSMKGEEKETFMLIKADLLRRTEQFDLLIKEYKDKVFSQEILNKIALFQIEKAKQQDTDCYTVADVQ